MADSKPKRRISRNQYLQAFALFTIAQRRYQEARAYEFELLKLLGIDESADLCDSIYGDGHKFDDALALEGLEPETQTAFDEEFETAWKTFLSAGRQLSPEPVSDEEFESSVADRSEKTAVLRSMLRAVLKERLL